MTFRADWDVKITNAASTERKFRLLRTPEGKAWMVGETPPSPRLNLGGREGSSPVRLLPFEQDDWSFGSGLLRFTPQANLPGHSLRYADGFGIDTAETGLIEHGPALLSDVGNLALAPLDTLMFVNKVWFLTTTHLYSWDGSTLALFWTNSDGAVNKSMVVHSNEIIVAGGAKYYHTDGTAAPTAIAEPTDYLLSIGKLLIRVHTTDQMEQSDNPTAATPTWGTAFSVGDGTAVTNLFSISGLVGVATQSTLYIVDSSNKSIELSQSLKVRRSANAFSIKSQSGADVWFSDTADIIRMVARGFESFDLQRNGPFHSINELPMTTPDPSTVTVDAITQDIDAVYVVVRRSSNTYIYKGRQIIRDLFVWTPLLKLASATAAVATLARLSGDSDPIFYFNDGVAIKRFATNWTTYTSSWEVETPYFTATLESWDKMWKKLRGFVELSGASAKITVAYKKDVDTSWTTFGSSGEMATDGNNSISLSTPITGKRIQLRFTGSRTTDTHFANLRSFLLEGLLRPDLDRVFDFTLVVDNKGDADFIYNLRTSTADFIKIEDRFGVSRTAFILPGFPVEREQTDDVVNAPVRTYQINAQEVT